MFKYFLLNATLSPVETFTHSTPIIVLKFTRFLHPLVYGEYPRTVQEIVGERLPKFTSEEVKIVKGSIDFVGINQYTTYYMYDPHQSKPKVPGYQMDWNAGFACKSMLPLKHRLQYFLCICIWSIFCFLEHWRCKEWSANWSKSKLELSELYSLL